ncbi:MAG: response regulator [Verrucomicrobiota bacterium]
MARILVIDDQPGVREMIAMMIQRAGHECFEARDGNRGLKLVEQVNLDLVITDILMPEKEGIETIIELRKRFPAIRVVAISGGGDSKKFDYLPMAEKLGAHATLRKPFDQAALLGIVENLLSAEG